MKFEYSGFVYTVLSDDGLDTREVEVNEMETNDPVFARRFFHESEELAYQRAHAWMVAKHAEELRLLEKKMKEKGIEV